MGKPLIFNIQKYSIHDGEGIRTTVFFKGCPLSCLWCHNPESQRFQKELLFHRERCRGCGACVMACPHGAVSARNAEPTAGTLYPGQPVSPDGSKASQPAANAFAEDRETAAQEAPLPYTDRSRCQICGACGAACPYNAREEAGKEYRLRDLIRELEKDRMFYEQSGGGVTLSGGEALAQDMDYIEELARSLHQKGYSVDIDTCGHVPYDHIRRILPYTDAFLYDIKLLDPEAHRKYTGADNRLILENLKSLSADGGKINLRLPLIHGVNATEQYLKDVIRFLQDNTIHVYRINLLKYHSAGSGKYAKLNRPYDKDSLAAPDAEWLAQAMEQFRQNGFQNIQIGG